MEDFQKRLKELRGSESQKDFAQRLHSDEKLISDYETGRTKPKLNFFENATKAGINSNWLAAGVGEKYLNENNIVAERGAGYLANKVRAVPIVGAVECGEPVTNWNTFGDKLIDYEGIGNLHSPFLLNAQGDSMYPLIQQGDLLLCSDNSETIKNGKIVVVCFKSDIESSSANAKLYYELKDKEILLCSINSKYEPQVYSHKQIYRIYKVHKIIRDLK